MMKYYLIASLILLFGCGPASDQQSDQQQKEGVKVEKKPGSQAWPFRTIEAGTVRCLEGQYVILVATNGRTYALNGTARQVASERGWQKLDGEQIVGKSISPILDAGLKQCQ